ncbi:MAG: hypothetical protein PHX78_09850 [bacterium]|nr:hypothetical protein [bacterium]
MKKSILLLAAFTFLVVCNSFAVADMTDNAAAHVFLNIVPNIAVTATDANVAAQSLQTGAVLVPISFRVDANTEAVDLSVLVTNLYKGNDPAGTEVAPILPAGGGVQIDPDNANEMGGGDGFAEFVTGGSYTNEKGTFEGMQTQEVIFESSQNGHFSQNVEVIPSWSNEDNEKPVGQYSGYVILYSAVVGASQPGY